MILQKKDFSNPSWFSFSKKSPSFTFKAGYFLKLVTLVIKEISFISRVNKT